MVEKFEQWRADIRNANLIELIDLLARQNPNDDRHRAIMAEITRRQTEAMLAASKAQVDASEAAKKAASHSGRMTTYMLWSVIVLTVTAFVNVIIAIFP